MATSASPTAGGERDCVVLLHGIGMRPFTLDRIARNLRTDGYRVANPAYPSRQLSFEALAGEFLPAQLEKHEVARAPRLNFVTHSMGSLVLRKFLADSRPKNLGRVVMIGPPNHGSAAADRARENAVLRKFFGGNLARLGTGEGGIARTLPAADFELGIIAGNGSINPLFARALGGPHDGVVTVESAKLDGMRDFLVVPYSHTVMLWRKQVMQQVRAFLRDGRFEHPQQKAKAP